VSIISLHFQHGQLFFPLDENVYHSILKASQTPARIQEIHKFIRKETIDVVINVDTGMGYIGILAATGTGAKVITWEHSNYYNNWNSRLFPHLRKFAARKSSAIVVLTERDKYNYETNIKRCVPVTVIANPVKKQENEYNEASKTILSAGALGKIKRFDLIVSIGKIIFEKHPDWQWVICGDGPEREDLLRKTAEAKMQKNICFCGSVSDMDSKYRQAAMYVLTSEMEGLPMVLLEAKSHGLPIISFDIETGPSEVIRDGVNGYLIESGDVHKMADRICRLIEDESLRTEFAKNAVLDMEKFDEEMIVNKWEQLLKEI